MMLKKEPRRTRYFKKSLKQLIQAVISCAVFLGYVLLTVKFHNEDPPAHTAIIGGIFFIGAILFSSLGFINGIKSYRHKEGVDTYKIILVLGGNFLFFGLFGLLIIVNLLDLARVF